MSSYYQIFAKAKKSGEYIELCNYSQSYFHDVFCMMNLPYGKIVPLDKNDIVDAMRIAEKLLDNNVKSIEKCKKQITETIVFSPYMPVNSTDKKIVDIINDIHNEIEELETEKDSLQDLLAVLNFFEDFLENENNQLFIGNDVDIDNIGDNNESRTKEV